MQQFKHKFKDPDGSTDGTLQSCIRTNDIDSVGDGTHLTYFEMLGNFSFKGTPYSESVGLWNEILTDLNIPCDPIHVHPQSDLHSLWTDLGYEVVDDEECVWTDGEIGGFCCEVYSRGIEIGNLVNTLGHSTDVGFGYERILMILEGKDRVDETSLFNQNLEPVLRDHVRTLNSFWLNGIEPGTKGRNYICRLLLRRTIRRCLIVETVFDEWLESERKLLDNVMRQGRRLLRRHQDKKDKWWWESIGLTPEDVKLLKSE